LRQWELEAINQLGWTEMQWCSLAKDERLRKLCALKLRDWMTALETEKQHQKFKAKHGK
jgi:hypothetical protein